jgi:arsenate reductase
MKNKIILFICKGNSGRSQMAEAFFNNLSKTGKAISAGTKPDKKIHPWTVQIMKEVGINIGRQKAKLVTKKLMKKSDKIIIMDSDLSESMPKEFSSKLKNWQIEKLLGKSINQVRKIRNKIKERVEQLIKEMSIKDFDNKAEAIKRIIRSH